MNWRFACTFILCIWIALFVGQCASLPRESAQVVVIDPAVRLNLALLHHRLSGHTLYPDHEWAFCLQGRERENTLMVEDLAVAQIDSASAISVWFSCRPTPNWIGAWHPHLTIFPDSTACRLSASDIAWQDHFRAPLMLITCGANPTRFLYRTLK